MNFTLHPRLAADTSLVTDWPLCRVLLMEDARYFWLILVPRIMSPPSALRIASAATGTSSSSALRAPGGGRPVTEITDLSVEERAQLMEEAARAGTILKSDGAVKLNIGALGNLVPQLHLHVIARQPGDPAWPGAVWGHSPSSPYEAVERAARIALVRSR